MAATFRRLIPTAIAAVKYSRPSRRGILDYPGLSSLGSFLLRKTDLPPRDPDYLRVVDREHFRKKYGVVKRIFIYEDDAPQSQRPLRKYAAVLPLEVRELGVIPISPFYWIQVLLVQCTWDQKLWTY